MATFQGPSGLAEDRCVNTFHFTHDVLDQAEAELSARLNVHDFYVGPVTGNTQFRPIYKYLSPWCQRPFTITSYDLATPKPRVPTIDHPIMDTPGSTYGCAEEVAVCLSYWGTAPHSPRRRGRLYIGPLAEIACTPSDGGNPTRPNTNLTQDLAAAAARLRANSISSGLLWCIRSSLPTENFVEIVGGYIDNALDTQRRRGPDATVRVPWGLP